MINREDILKCLGDFPERVNLDMKEISSEDMGAYVRKLIEYNVEKCNENIRVQNNDIIEKVQAYLLIPKEIKGKNPAILAIHQHHRNWQIGKSEVVGITDDKMYAYGLDLVKQGYVVIAPDILCFESRLGNDEYRKDKEGNRYFERFELIKYLSKGSTLQAKTLHDLSVTIDVLCSLDFVDKDRIGVIGHSLGGQESIWVTWYDKRIKVAASSCGVSCINDFIESGYQYNSWACIPNLLKYCDIDSIINDIVKDRKLIITNGLKDDIHCPLTGIDKIEKTIGNNSNFKSIKFDDGHKFNDTEKEIVYEFLNNELLK